jgi:hypothetical protein
MKYLANGYWKLLKCRPIITLLVSCLLLMSYKAVVVDMWGNTFYYGRTFKVGAQPGQYLQIAGIRFKCEDGYMYVYKEKKKTFTSDYILSEQLAIATNKQASDGVCTWKIYTFKESDVKIEYCEDSEILIAYQGNTITQYTTSLD